MPKRIVFEPEYVEAMRTLFEETIPFNRVLGLKIDAIRPSTVRPASPPVASPWSTSSSGRTKVDITSSVIALQTPQVRCLAP